MFISDQVELDFDMVETGYNQKIFFNLTNQEKEELSCSICHHILRNPHQCSNGHQFCHFCITTWTYKGNHASCPMCRVDCMYKENETLHELINRKIVHCEWHRCFWTGPVAELETHAHMIYTERDKKDPYQGLSVEPRQSRQSQKSMKTEQNIAKQNTVLSKQIQKLEVEYHGRKEKMFKRILEGEWRKLKNAEKMRRRLIKSERHIREEYLRLFHRMQEVELRKSKEVDDNRRRVKSLDLMKEQLREASLRRSIREQKEKEDENQSQKCRIERMIKKRETEKEKALEKLKELEKIKCERSCAFKRHLDREKREWKDKIESLLHRITKMERKRDEKIKYIRTELMPNNRGQNSNLIT